MQINFKTDPWKEVSKALQAYAGPKIRALLGRKPKDKSDDSKEQEQEKIPLISENGCY